MWEANCDFYEGNMLLKIAFLWKTYAKTLNVYKDDFFFVLTPIIIMKKSWWKFTFWLNQKIFYVEDWIKEKNFGCKYCKHFTQKNWIKNLVLNKETASPCPVSPISLQTRREKKLNFFKVLQKIFDFTFML